MPARGKALSWAIAVLALAVIAFALSWITITAIALALPVAACAHWVFARSQKAGRRWALAALVFAYAGAGISLIDAAKVTPSRESRAVVSLERAKSLFRACRRYASDHGGKLPISLPDLVPEYVGDETLLSDPKDPAKNGIGYYYYGAQNQDGADSPRLLASRAIYRGRRAVIRMDGSALLADVPQARYNVRRNLLVDFLTSILPNSGSSVTAVTAQAEVSFSLQTAKEIFSACKSYAIDHDGKFPDTLGDLLPAYLTDPILLEDPADPGKQEVGYLYYGRGRIYVGEPSQESVDPAVTPFLVSKVPIRGLQRVVYLDGFCNLVSGVGALPSARLPY